MRSLLAVLMLLLTSSPRSALAQGRPADERAVREVITATGAALNARDWEAASRVFAVDGDVILQGSPRVSGRPAIRAFWAKSWAAAPAQRRITLSVASLRLLGPDVALADCTATFTVGVPVRDRATYVLVRRGGTWQVAALRVMPAESPTS